MGIIKKNIEPSSTKSQPHQPPQFNSCWAHQAPSNIEKKENKNA
jgi:hypothetical protein